MTCSVVLATYNGEKFIKDQLCSILSQKRRPEFILLSDDGSSDRTVEISERLLSSSGIAFAIKTRESSVGVTNNFLSASNMVDTDIVFFCDQDDIWMDSKIEKMMSIFEKNPNCTEVITNSYIWECKGKEIKNEDIKGKLITSSMGILTDKDGFLDKDFFWRLTINKNIAQGMSMGVRRTIIQRGFQFIQYYNSKYFKSESDKLLMYHDSFYNIIAGSLGNVCFVDEPLAYYRQHGKNVEGGLYHFTLEVIKKSKNNVNKSFAKHNERMNIIEELNLQYSFLNDSNLVLLKEHRLFFQMREFYIKNSRVFAMIKLSGENMWYYDSIGSRIRDVIVTSIYKIGALW